jgi:hypothetical protein
VRTIVNSLINFVAALWSADVEDFVYGDRRGKAVRSYSKIKGLRYRGIFDVSSTNSRPFSPKIAN